MISVTPLPDPDLHVALDIRLEPQIPAGFRGALFCFGHCFHRHRRVLGLSLLVDGRPHRPNAYGMPRLDLYDSRLAGPHSYRSGFWATVPVSAGDAPGFVELEAAVRLDDGEEVRRRLARLEVVRPEPEPGALADAGVIAICLATFEPDVGLLERQLDSIRAQTDERWICVVSDGGSSAERFAELERLVAQDDRFTLSRSADRLDPYRNFERALRMVPRDIELIALSDQDDRWYPDKLATLRAGLGDGQLVYSDLRLVTSGGEVLRGSLWEGRRNEYRNLASLLIANTVPGAAMLMRREVAALALPFPHTPNVEYHDHWLALVALASGEVTYVDRPLYDWVQHPGAMSAASGRSETSRWRAAYFCAYMPRQVQALTLLMRCRSALTPRKRRALRWFVASERGVVPFLWLALRPLRLLVGRGETLGAELGLARGIVWRWLLGTALRALGGSPRLPADTRFPDPPAFDQPRLRRWRSGR